MEVIYTAKDQERIDSIDKSIKEYELLLMKELKRGTSSDMEIRKRFFDDPHRLTLQKIKTDIMSVIVPAYIMTITK